MRPWCHQFVNLSTLKCMLFCGNSHGGIMNVLTDICWQTAYMLHLLYSCSYVRILTQIWKLLPITVCITLSSCCPWFWCVLCSCALTSGALLVIIKPFCSPFTSSHSGSFHMLVINHWITTPSSVLSLCHHLFPGKSLSLCWKEQFTKIRTVNVSSYLLSCQSRFLDAVITVLKMQLDVTPCAGNSKNICLWNMSFFWGIIKNCSSIRQLTLWSGCEF